MKKYFAKINVIAVVFSLLLQIIPFQAIAGELENEKDTLSRLKASTAANHTISFNLSAATNWDASDTLTLTFPTGFGLTGLANTDATDYDIKTAGVDEAIVAAGGCGITDSIEITSIVGQVITFTACPSYTAPGVGSAIEIEIGTHATFGATGNTQITNPTAGNDKIISIAGTIGDTGSLAVSILSDDQVVVTATVDPNFTFTISSATCALGTLSTAAVNSCTYNVTTTTNAEDGYATTILDDGNLRDGANDINDVADGAVTAGVEEYGIGLTGTDRAFADERAITTAAMTIASDTTGPINAQAVAVAHKASITSQTVAGTYSHTVTLVSTGTF